MAVSGYSFSPVISINVIRVMLSGQGFLAIDLSHCSYSFEVGGSFIPGTKSQKVLYFSVSFLPECI